MRGTSGKQQAYKPYTYLFNVSKESMLECILQTACIGDNNSAQITARDITQVSMKSELQQKPMRVVTLKYS